MESKSATKEPAPKAKKPDSFEGKEEGQLELFKTTMIYDPSSGVERRVYSKKDLELFVSHGWKVKESL